jgi:murein DD-endopeptidase MepM/ murein hydrolase activator NlpD
MTVYGHNSKNLVSKGDRIDKGDRIAKVGQTGDASGPHLHFETRVMDDNGRYAAVNPMVFYP